MTLKERARALVSGIEHGDETHRQWLRDVATPAILAALEETQREALEEAIAAIRADHHRQDYTTFAEIAIRALIDAPRQGETQV